MAITEILPGIHYVGVNDRTTTRFEALWSLPMGVSYNAYLVAGEKIALIDTVEESFGSRLEANISEAIGERKIDYLVVNHMEPDHSSSIAALRRIYPDIEIVGNAKTLQMIEGFYGIAGGTVEVKEGNTLDLGGKTLSFHMIPMVHWPETMVTWCAGDRTLFSGDAFGTFGALDGNLFADEINFVSEKLPEARRYYANIVGKYGAPVQALLKKAAALPVKTVCPLHGPVWRENIAWFVDKYDKWSSYTPEENAVAIFYGSVYGHTQEAAEILASCLADLEVKNIKVYDVSARHSSYLVAEAFRCSHLVFASSTYNAGIFENMDILIDDLIKHALQNRKVALIENGSWASTAGMLMKEKLSKCKNTEFIGDVVTIKSALKENQLADIKALAKKIASSLDG